MSASRLFRWSLARRSSQSLQDPSPPGIGGGQLHLDPIPGKDAHRLEASLASRVRQDPVPVLQLDPVERVGKGFDHPPHERLVATTHRARRIGLSDSSWRVYRSIELRSKAIPSSIHAAVRGGSPPATTVAFRPAASSDGRRVSTRGPSSVTATVCSK